MADEAEYTTEQVTIAARELLQAAGSETDASPIAAAGPFSTKDPVAALSEGVHLLRVRGFTDERIASLITGFDIEVSAEDVAKHAPERES